MQVHELRPKLVLDYGLNEIPLHLEPLDKGNDKNQNNLINNEMSSGMRT